MYFWPRFFMKPLEVTQKERELFGLKADELGFVTSTPKKEPQESKPTKPKQSPTPPFEISLNNFNPDMTGIYSSSPNTSLLSLNSTNLSLNNTFSTSFNTSSQNISLSNSWTSPNKSSLIGTPEWTQENSSFRKRNISKIKQLSPSIIDEKSLNEYLKSYDEKEQRQEQLKEVELQQQNTSGSPWSLSQAGYEQKMSYQLSADLPALNSNSDNSLSLLISPSNKAVNTVRFICLF